MGPERRLIPQAGSGGCGKWEGIIRWKVMGLLTQLQSMEFMFDLVRVYSSFQESVNT